MILNTFGPEGRLYDGDEVIFNDGRIVVVRSRHGHHDLYCNGWKIGHYVAGKEKKFEDPIKWAGKQLAKRKIVIYRNIERLKQELDLLYDELKGLGL